MKRYSTAARQAQTWGRRAFLKNIGTGVLGLGLAEHLELEALASASSGRSVRARNVLVLYEEGGISQMDSWDPKPDQIAEHRSPFAPIATNVPGIRFSSLLPLMAKHADKLAVVRSMTTTRVAGHIEGCLEFFKGYRFDTAPFAGATLGTHRFPDIGTVATHLLDSENRQLPGYAFVPGANLPNFVNGSGFLPSHRAAWRIGNRGFHEDLSTPGWSLPALKPHADLGTARLGERMRLLDQLQPSRWGTDGVPQSLSRYQERAHGLLTSPEVKRAFDFSTESERVRDRYGRGHRGHCYLLGRKLIEAGVRFVTVTVIEPPAAVKRTIAVGQPGGVLLNWDHHEGIYFNGPCGGPQAMAGGERYGLPHPIMMPSLDRSLSALLEDMDQRGLLAETLVCFVTEMGRTPRLNKWQGRDHWSRAMSIAFAGAGIPGGQTIGTTDKEGGEVLSDRYTPCDYAETIYHKLGIDTTARLKMADGRPIDFTEGGQPIRELF
ncbi:MAG: DUF1501 domain-containing protein [Planctomycetes bacterium]|nr:DUF1501 domain-containing protein [Planctomycetota bacterium]